MRFFAIIICRRISLIIYNDTLIEENDCGIDRKNTLNFQIILMMGTVFVSISALISFYINKIERKNLLSKLTSISSAFILI